MKLLKKLFKKSRKSFFKEENKILNKEKEHISPTGNYKIIINSFSTGNNTWNYTQGTVYKKDSKTPIAIIQRNYSSFPFTWIEPHPNGHSYLVCGKDYQGQTVIELDTGKRKNFIPPDAKKGYGFCWAEYRFDYKSCIMIVDGCIWACPYEFRFYDFLEPMKGWPEIKLENGYIDSDNKWPEILEDNTIRCFKSGTDEYGDPTKETVAIKTFKIYQIYNKKGLNLELIDEWVSKQEEERRIKQQKCMQKYEQWLENFKATDSLYLEHLKEAKDPLLSPEKYFGIGITYEGWCKDFTKQEKRMCKRIVTDNNPYIIELEWAVDSGPIKIIIFSGGKHLEDKFFEHSLVGMRNAFSYVKSKISSSIKKQ